MLEIKPVLDKDAVRSLYNEKGIEYDAAHSFGITAKNRDTVLGVCLFNIDNEYFCINYIEPEDDILLLDGIFRSALLVVTNHKASIGKWAETVDGNLIEKIGFAKDMSNRLINMDNFCTSCQNCKKM